jgi:dimethylaniline monooxygenase (N-oxide forming)
MLLPTEPATAGARPSGLDMCNYIESYCDRFLKGKVEFIFNTEVLDISRNEIGEWLVRLEDLQTGTKDILKFKRIIVATGVSHSTFMLFIQKKLLAIGMKY